MVRGRALHFVFKVADRTLTAKFYREVLGMKVKKIILYSNYLKLVYVVTKILNIFI